MVLRWSWRPLSRMKIRDTWQIASLFLTLPAAFTWALDLRIGRSYHGQAKGVKGKWNAREPIEWSPVAHNRNHLSLSLLSYFFKNNNKKRPNTNKSPFLYLTPGSKNAPHEQSGNAFSHGKDLLFSSRFSIHDRQKSLHRWYNTDDQSTHVGRRPFVLALVWWEGGVEMLWCFNSLFGMRLSNSHLFLNCLVYLFMV